MHSNPFFIREIRACHAEASAKAGNPWSFLKIFALFPNFAPQFPYLLGEE